jgi:hypothetical protein
LCFEFNLKLKLKECSEAMSMPHDPERCPAAVSVDGPTFDWRQKLQFNFNFKLRISKFFNGGP